MLLGEQFLQDLESKGVNSDDIKTFLVDTKAFSVKYADKYATLKENVARYKNTCSCNVYRSTIRTFIEQNLNLN